MILSVIHYYVPLLFILHLEYMKIKLLAAAFICTLLGCDKVITKGDTAVTFPIRNQEMIKIFNDHSFAFFKHDTNKAKGDSAVFDAGGGSYTLRGEDYAEHLEFCNYRGWENRDFNFKLRMRNDSLIQTGIEKIDSLNINQEIVEIYIRKN
jgi:hypothetical protein